MAGEKRRKRHRYYYPIPMLLIFIHLIQPNKIRIIDKIGTIINNYIFDITKAKTQICFCSTRRWMFIAKIYGNWNYCL